MLDESHIVLALLLALCFPTAAEVKYWPDNEGPFLALESKARSGEPGVVRVSHYWPPWGGSNCSWFVGGVCRSRTASGERWEDWTEQGAACPRVWLEKVEVYARGTWWLCVDTGGGIVVGADGISWVDFMTEMPLQDYGTTLGVRVREVK